MILAAITTHKRMPDILERAVKSVIAQTYADWNLVVVDDSPADWEHREDVRNMVESYAQRDKRIRYVAHDRNYGAQRARNTALKIADQEGFEFIAYLDDDDEWLPEKLEKQIARFNECDEDTALVYCFYIYVDEKQSKVFVEGDHKCRNGYVFDEIMLHDFVASMFPLVRVKCLVALSGFDEEMLAHQDYDMWIRVSKHYKFACVPEPLAKLHRYEGEHIWANMQKPIMGHERLIKKYQAYYQKTARKPLALAMGMNGSKLIY